MILLALSVPLLVVARRRGATGTTRRFLVAAAVVAVLCAFVAAGSERLVDQCEAAGNLDCVDFGGTGLQLLFVAGYGVPALVKAFHLSRQQPAKTPPT